MMAVRVGELVILKQCRTLKLAPHICATSNSAAFLRQWMLESMMLSLYWIGMDQPAKGTIFPGKGR